MRKTGILLLTAVCAVMFAACGGTVENKPANVANTAKPAPAAPTAEMFMDLEKKANEAYTKADTAYFQTLLADKAVMAMGKDRMGKAEIVKMIGTAKCEGAEVKLSDPQMVKLDNDTYAFSYKNESTGKCNEGPNGAMVEMKPSRDATVWVRSGDKWQAAWHSSTLIMDPKATAGDKKDDKAEVKKEEPKKAEPKKEDATEDAAPAAKKDDAKKDEAKKDDKAAPATDAKPAALTPSANTEALAKMHASGWEAFQKKDAKFFETTLASTFAFVDPMGGWHSSKAETIKIWTETMKCENITKTSFTDAFAVALSPTVELLMGKGTADGTCDGMKNGDLWQTSAYVKEGDAWKLAFMFEQPGK